MKIKLILVIALAIIIAMVALVPMTMPHPDVFRGELRFACVYESSVTNGVAKKALSVVLPDDKAAMREYASKVVADLCASDLVRENAKHIFAEKHSRAKIPDTGTSTFDDISLQDITCDSDGKIDMFVRGGDVSRTLPLHELKNGEPYYIAVYLVGAYQEILGDLHNLFGDTNAVHIVCNDKGGYEIDKVIDGESVEDVLDYVNFSDKALVRTMENWVSRSVKEGKISLQEGKEFLNIYRGGLYGYTYLE